MIRVVLDTNVLVSAILSPFGPPARILQLALARADVELCLSGEVYAEYEDVLRRPRLHRSEAEIASILRAVHDCGFWVKPTRRVTVCLDPDDDIFLECAEASEADYLVTGNLKHFPTSWDKTQIVSPRSLVDALL
jgi:putative PIN family toxin of toxin-antitoxin system